MQASFWTPWNAPQVVLLLRGATISATNHIGHIKTISATAKKNHIGHTENQYRPKPYRPQNVREFIWRHHVDTSVSCSPYLEFEREIVHKARKKLRLPCYSEGECRFFFKHAVFYYLLPPRYHSCHFTHLGLPVCCWKNILHCPAYHLFMQLWWILKICVKYGVKLHS